MLHLYAEVPSIHIVSKKEIVSFEGIPAKVGGHEMDHVIVLAMDISADCISEPSKNVLRFGSRFAGRTSNRGSYPQEVSLFREDLCDALKQE